MRIPRPVAGEGRILTAFGGRCVDIRSPAAENCNSARGSGDFCADAWFSAAISQRIALQVPSSLVLAGRRVPLLCQGVFLAAVFGLSVMSVTGEPSILARERARRAAATEEAWGELRRGDVAYEAQQYEDAVAAYATARGLLSDSAQTGELRSAATLRFAQASVERARQLAKGGRRDDADELLDVVLAPDVLPTYAPARQLKEQIFDPIHYNPALTVETVRDVDKVRRLLYEGEGFGSLGQYDRALEVYEEVLRIDPTNHAARRAMEAIHGRRSDFFDAARDATRANMLAQTDAAWETPVPPVDFGVGPGVGPIGEENIGGRTAGEKLRSMIVPRVDLTSASLSEAVDFLRQQSINLDTMELDESRRGISFVIDLGTGESPLARRIESTRFNLQLSNLPLGEVLDYITSATKTRVRIDEHAVIILPLGAVTDEMISRRWRVPPDFLSRESIDPEGGDNPFDEKPTRGLLGAKLTAKEFLKKQGVSFPEGASAGFTSFDSTLSVRNTRPNVDFVEQIVDAIMGEEPVAVKIEVRFVNIAQDQLTELGFDWLTSGAQLNGGMFLGGGTVGSGTPILDFGRGLDPVTSGNRSGVAAENNSTIDALIRAGNRSSGGPDQSNVRAPGILSMAGVWNDEVIAVLMRGMDRAKGVDWAIKKSVLTRSGQTAMIHSVREIIYPTEYEPPELPNSVGGGGFVDLTTGEAQGGGGTYPVTPATPTAFEKRNVGCTLEVEPLVGPNRRYVEVALKPEVVTFDGFIDYGSPIGGGSAPPAINLAGVGNPNVPVFTTTPTAGQITQNSILMPVFSVTRSNTNLTILDGSTIVLGGMLNESHFKYEDKVPILGNIPFIGRFFTTEAESGTKNVLLIFVKVELLDPAGHRYRDR